MGETALNFGPEWLRALSHGSNSSVSSSSQGIPMPKYNLAEFRYGREEMLALFPKDPKLPDCLKEFQQLAGDKCQLPLALIPITEDEQRIWARSVNSDAVLRASGKTVPSNLMSRTGRGGSVDRGRGRGRGSFYYSRGLSHEDVDDAPVGSFPRPKLTERSQSASEKDQRWDDRDRRYDRPFSGRGDDSISKAEGSRTHEHWRKFDKDEDCDWRLSGPRSADKLGSRGSWRNTFDRDNQNRNASTNGTTRTSHLHQKGSNVQLWPVVGPGNSIPEWSVEESNEADSIGTFDSSGAFLETKEETGNKTSDVTSVSNNAEEGMSNENPPEATKANKKKTQNFPNQSTVKPSTEPLHKEEAIKVIRNIESVIEPCKNKNGTNNKAEIPTDNVIQCGIGEKHRPNINSNKTSPLEYPFTLPNVPEVVERSTKGDNIIFNTSQTQATQFSTSSTTSTEEDAFAHHKKATENMVAQWTEEEEQQVISHTVDSKQHETDYKWLYQDPQGAIQGPFNSADMLEWFAGGYFNLKLVLRRVCDDKFARLGDLVDIWGRLPFIPGKHPPPIRVTSPSHPVPMTQTVVPNPVTAPSSSQLPKQDEQLLAMQQQQQLIQQQIMQQQLLVRHAQVQQLLGELKQQDKFTSLSPQQQQQVLMQQFIAQQQLTRPPIGPMGDQAGILDPMQPLAVPLVRLTVPPILNNDLPLWNTGHASAIPWHLPIGLVRQPPGHSIWDVDVSKESTKESDLEKKTQFLVLEQEKLRLVKEQLLEMEKKLEEKRKTEECRIKELQKQEEEDERQRQIEAQQRIEELRQLQEKNRKEEELKKQEELRRIEEQRRAEELQRKEELKQFEKIREEEFRHVEELQRQEELKKQELQRQEELRRQEEKKKKDAQKKLQMEKEQEKLIEIERQKEALRLKELRKEEKVQKEKEKQKEKEEAALKKLAELKLKSQGPVWGIQTMTNSELSLPDIQRLQEEKEKQEKDEKNRQQLLQQQAMKQVQPSKSGLSWAKRSSNTSTAVKSLTEIQQEEAERLEQQLRTIKSQMPTPSVGSNVGVWGNTSQVASRIASVPQSWTTNPVASSGFWDDGLNNANPRKPPKTIDSAFPALVNSVQPASVNSNKSKTVRKKREDDVTRLFGVCHIPTDEFTLWCTEALSSLPSSVDVPTFVAFLKDIESPYEVYDYVKSYLGEGKGPREFARQFLERRSKFRNEAKKTPSEENMWGPAPALTPIVNKLSIQNASDSSDGNSNTKGKIKKRKNKMQKLDSSMLGFTVQSNPDRLNVGEIDHVEGM